MSVGLCVSVFVWMLRHSRNTIFFYFFLNISANYLPIKKENCYCAQIYARSFFRGSVVSHFDLGCLKRGRKIFESYS
jgi:hypothetical protein